jgi:hypothetical protein
LNLAKPRVHVFVGNLIINNQRTILSAAAFLLVEEFHEAEWCCKSFAKSAYLKEEMGKTIENK